MKITTQKYMSLNERLAKESNAFAKKFNNKRYSRIENINKILLSQDKSVESKKIILIKKLHKSILETFSIDKKKFNKKSFNSLKKRLNNIRRVILKLRSINYYLETTFLNDLRLSRVKIGKGEKLKQADAIVKNELETLEYSAYKLIRKAVILDKRLLSEYSHKEKGVASEEKIEIKGLGSILKKESGLLEHLEAKLPPPKSLSMALIKEPNFTHWIARVFALLLYFEYICAKEAIILSRLKKNKSARAKIRKKITELISEKSKLLEIMQNKAISMKKLKIDDNFRKELHKLTTTIAL